MKQWEKFQIYLSYITMVGKKEKAHFQKKELKTQNIQQGLVTIYCSKISAYIREKYKTEGKQFKQTSGCK